MFQQTLRIDSQGPAFAHPYANAKLDIIVTEINLTGTFQLHSILPLVTYRRQIIQVFSPSIVFAKSHWRQLPARYPYLSCVRNKKDKALQRVCE